MKPVLFSILLFYLLMFPLWGESTIITKMELYDTVARMGESTWLNNGSGFLTVRFDQKNNKHVKSQLRITAASASDTGDFSFSIERAYVKFRFPYFRAVIGKAPSSWGEGLIFNAGNLLFADSGIQTNLMQQDFSGTAAWMTGITIPLSPFSYTELVSLPPDSIFLGIGASKAGGRIVSASGPVKIEAGYLYDGSADIHKTSISFQVNSLLNSYISAAAYFPAGSTFTKSLKSSLLITAGLYSMTNIGYSGTLFYRLETRIKPNGVWTQDDGIYLYSELSYAFQSGKALILRGFISPVDRSSVIVPGFSWNVFQGFTFTSLISLGTGSPGSTFAWTPESTAKSGFSLMAGVSVVY